MIRLCQVCGSKNRVPAQYAGQEGRCGKCQSPLPPSGEPFDADDALFDEVVRDAPVPVLVDFWGAGCGPCRMSAPEVEAIAREMAGRLVVLKVDVEKHAALAARFRVRSIPNFVLLRNGKVAMQRTGAMTRAEMRRWLDAVAA